jgi:hypothetical protein
VTIRAVLDTASLTAYAQLKGMAVAELALMVAEEGADAHLAIPAGCFMAAYATLDDAGRRLLTDLATGTANATIVLPLTGVDAIEAARIDAAHDAPGLGHAIIATRTHHTLLATYRPELAMLFLPEDQILRLT